MTDNSKNTKAKQRRSATMEESRKTYLPGMGHDWLLSLYDPLQKLLGFESLHRQLVDQAAIRPKDLCIACAKMPAKETYRPKVAETYRERGRVTRIF
jgi:hypothetical protein